MIQLTDVVKTYDARVVLSIPFLQLGKGMYLVKGANGSGKTTLLKMIAGLLTCTGNIKVNDICLSEKPVLYRKQVSWAEAEPLYPPFLTGRELIRFYCDIRNALPAGEDRLVDLFEMNDYIGTAVGTYSAGMTKKLSLLLSLIGDVPLVILDEPFITLDAKAIAVLCSFLMNKQKGTGMSFLISSHQDVESFMFDKQLIIQDKTIAVV